MNNLFDYATSELSQDAVICWCLNWLNEPEAELYPLAVDLLKKMGEGTVEKGQALRTIRQFYKTDVLVCLAGTNRVILIEDKTDTSEHGEQLRRYREQLTQLSEEERRFCGIDENVELRTVYFKTGFFYDADRLVEADIKITGKEFLQCLAPYRGKSEILDAYLLFLERKLEQQTCAGDFLQEPERLNDSAIAQHTLMRMMFPETLWKPGSVLYEVYHGSSFGRPWTEMVIAEYTFPAQKDGYRIFWRIDRDREGTYLSLRFYDPYDKKDAMEKQTHIEAYRKHRAQIEKICTDRFESDSIWALENVRCGYTENYYEASLLTLHLEPVLQHWDTEHEAFLQGARTITEQFQKENQG